MGLQEQISELANELNPPTETAEQDEVVDEVEQDEVVETEGAEPIEGTDDITTIAGLSEAIGWDASDIYAMNVGMGDNKDPIPLGELKDKYQESETDRAAMQQKMADMQALVDSAKVQQGQMQQQSQAIQQAASNVGAIEQQYNAVNWQAEEEEDPGRAALMRQKYSEAHAQAKGQLQQQQQVQHQQQAQYIQSQQQDLMKKIPEWSDSTVAATGKENIRALLVAEGASAEEINGVTSSWQVKLLNELVMLRAKQAGAVEAVKKARTAPKVIRGTGRQKAGNQTLVDKAVKHAATHRGDKRAEFDAVKALLTNR